MTDWAADLERMEREATGDSVRLALDRMAADTAEAPPARRADSYILLGLSLACGTLGVLAALLLVAAAVAPGALLR